MASDNPTLARVEYRCPILGTWRNGFVKKVLMFFKKEDRTGERGRILDVFYTITPDPGFVSQIKAANKRHSDGTSQIKSEIGIAGSDQMEQTPTTRKR